MNKQAIANTLKSLQKTMRKHSPAILTGIGIAGMAAAAVMAVRATPKALRMVDDREIEDEKRLTTSEIVKTTWKCYIPAAVTGVCSAACIIGASSISARRNAALVTAYTISETALKEYKDKAVEVVGPKNLCRRSALSRATAPSEKPWGGTSTKGTLIWTSVRSWWTAFHIWSSATMSRPHTSAGDIRKNCISYYGEPSMEHYMTRRTLRWKK